MDPYQRKARHPREFTYSGSARIVSWYAVHDADRFACSCGWHGSLTELETGIFSDLADGSCPQCDQMLLIRAFPTEVDMRRWAARGDERAIADLASIRQAAPDPDKP